ncbi:MAG: hypothetical protein ACTSYB_03455 [Candidatus Helarchaeota archaeon]
MPCYVPGKPLLHQELRRKSCFQKINPLTADYILCRRLAQGEITEEDYLTRKKLITE